jgi:hypothetical protein
MASWLARPAPLAQEIRMPSSNQGGQASAPYRSPGRNFLSTDPERQGEVMVQSRAVREDRRSAHAIQARPARTSISVVRGYVPGRSTLWDSDDEGGSGRRSR